MVVSKHAIYEEKQKKYGQETTLSYTLKLN